MRVLIRQEYPHELCSPDATGLLFHLESVAILSHRSPPSFGVAFVLMCIVLRISGSHSISNVTLFLIQEETKKADVCIRLAKTSPQSLEFLALPYWPELGLRACCSVNESIKGESIQKYYFLQ